MDFLSQIPMALLGRPTTGALDFATGAIGGLGTGDTGSINPGILGTLGRLGMMTMAVRQSKDPTAILRVKDYFDRQDAMKRDALAQPLAQNMTPEQFQQSAGFWAPPQKIIQNVDGGPLTPGDLTGGRARVVEKGVGTGADPREMLQATQASSRVNAAEAAPNQYDRRQILEHGFSAAERTAMSQQEFDQFSRDNKIDPREFAIDYQTNADGSIMQGYVRRPEFLQTSEEIEAAAREQNIDPKYFQAIKKLSGFDSSGAPLYDVDYMNRPRERVSQSLPEPIRTTFWEVLKQTGDPEIAAAEAGKIARGMSVSGGTKKEKQEPWQILEEADGVKFTPQEKIVIDRNWKKYQVPLDPSEAAFKKPGDKDSTQIIDEIRANAKSRLISDGSQKDVTEGKIEKAEPIKPEELETLVDVAIQEVAQGMVSNPEGTIVKFAQNLARHPRFAGISLEQKLAFGAKVIAAVIRNPADQIKYSTLIAQALGK